MQYGPPHQCYLAGGVAANKERRMQTSVDAEALALFVRDTQDALWTDLEAAVDRAINGSWSIEAANVCVSIVRAARLVGPTDWRECPTSLVFGGVWHALLSLADIEHDDLTAADEAYVADLYSRNSASPFSPQSWLLRYAESIAKMQTPRERAYILSGGE